MSAWTQIALPEPKPKQAKGGTPKKPRRLLTSEEWLRVQERCAAGESRQALAEDYGVSIQAVYNHTAGIDCRRGKQNTGAAAASERAAERPAERTEPPRAKTPDWVRRKAVERAQELQNTIAAREKKKAELERELTAFHKEFDELQAWLQDN